MLFPSPQRLPARLTASLALATLLFAADVQGAEAEDTPAPAGEARAEGTAAAVDPTAAEPTPTAKPAGAPPRRFIPTEQVSEDRAVAFPKDI